ncbi:MAG TPA: hypothetical protein QF753_15655 [Victivallales bacterium]|nr:hypothetical protein [Victivallales bacterium]
MNKITITTIFLLAGFSALAQSKPASVTPAVTIHKIQQSSTLRQSEIIRIKKIQALLQPKAKAKLNPIIRKLHDHLISGSKNTDFYAITRQKIHSKFPKISNSQSNLLCFYVLAKVELMLTHHGNTNKKLNNMNEMSEINSLKLQMTMERRSKLISTLSNIMKKISNTQDALVKNIK